METDSIAQQQMGAQRLDNSQRTAAVDHLVTKAQGSIEGQQGSVGIFSGLLDRLGKAVGGSQGGAHQAVKRFSQGVEGEVHESMMALEKADISFKFVNTVFKKGIDAYKEVTQRMG